MITAKILLDSINPDGIRIVTWILKYPRFIHAEFMTHRVFSRNAASSRAIPFKKMAEAIRDEPAMPEYWGANQSGMQAAGQIEDIDDTRRLWLRASDDAVGWASDLHDLGLHKQIANRVLEPFSHITVLATATEHDNFFALRAHPDAQPEFQVLAYRMLDEYLISVPVLRDWDDWHIPFGDQMPQELTNYNRLKVATARAARVSYLTFDGAIDPAKDIDLHDKLAASGHWSPFEHCAQADDFCIGSNFRGWRQYRKQFKDENKREIDLKLVMAAKPNWVTIENAQASGAEGKQP